MATILNSNLYPPIIDTYMPAFLKTTGCKVYFQLSSFNTIKDIYGNKDKTELSKMVADKGAAQVTVSNQKTNQSELAENYLNGIMLKEIYEDDKGFYIWIENTDIKEDFQINTYYKVQIRFTSTKIPSTPIDTAEWFNENLNYFSEWSTVSLIRAISTPSLDLSSVENDSLTAPNIIGKVIFEDPSETEGIELYRIVVRSSEGKILEDSDFIYSSSTQGNRELNYIFKTNLTLIQNGKVEIYVVTRNAYTISEVLNINVTSTETQSPSSEILQMEQDEENGLIKLTTKIINNSQHQVILKRTSSKTGFNIWEDVYMYDLTEKDTFSSATVTWSDYTIESGVWYKYAIQEQLADNSRTIIKIYNEEPIMMIFDNMFLDAGGRQLKIKYNPSVNSYKRNISETKIDTIGSQYPFIRRNGDMNYRQLTIAGMITSLSDEDEIQILHLDENTSSVETMINQGRLFTSATEIYGGEAQKELYENYNSEHQISKYNDFIYEREFREKVLDFLYKNDVKLFRSTPEGNVLVKLMNISLTPETTLGRYVYSFSCEAYEIGEATLENYIQYNIQKDLVKIEGEVVST